jgi:hypothetical protein
LGNFVLNRVQDGTIPAHDERTIDLPPVFLEWLSLSRVKIFEKMEALGPQSIRSQPSHLAVMATFDQEDGKINLATKGWGPVPIPEDLTSITTMFERAKNAPNLQERIGTAKSFYSDHRLFDHGLLGGLEIFEGKTYNNLVRDPHATILFTGEPPEYPSYQFEGIVTIVEPSNPYYEFLLKARQLFGHDPFHLSQTNYPWGYLFHPTNVTLKTPFSRS